MFRWGALSPYSATAYISDSSSFLSTVVLSSSVILSSFFFASPGVMAFRTNHILSHNSRYPLPLSPLDVDMKSTLASDPNSYSRPADFTTSSRLHKGVMYYGQGDMKEAIPLEIFRWLLVVTPPDILGAEGGKTLSSDVLMTLQHTLPNQLDAVAKEFGLPSTVGLRVFVHLTVEAGVPPVRPRVTDDVWPLLWAQYLHSNQHPSLTQLAGLPIAGHVEFDIDMQSARWYNTWRRHGDLSGAISSSHPVDTKIGFVPLDASNHFNEAHAKSRSSKTHIRHLSLLERRGEISRLHNSSRTNTLSGTNGFVVDAKEVQEVAYPKILPGHVPISPHVRSLVQEWRKRTPMGVVPHPEVPLGAPFVEADADVSEHMDDGILDLDDFPWSISSAGPPSYDGNDLMTLSPLPRSVHMADRRAGSVMTPSTATSFGSPIDGHASSTYPQKFDYLHQSHHE
ncbi:uncharacterized protein EI90DRAFT_1735280 [Cantharellus anzutake]|uniref:uncharacterized protein n=1 Tax=Cantharellus anzutake TaxID=1750568 RepID=UPI00190692C3|nr:uncharacterized protein EI90DRAFT_1735280 [Cantharellus anzutake]KAF8341412.1 hypothetical protein EI90DRAFT_1735280 [Cantharellus anzutake]